jgi:hypothetical protein
VHLAALRRVRWAVRATLALGVAASVGANILHALPNPISQTIAAWPPISLLVTIELISRVPMHRRALAGARLFATAAIAGIAAWVSYWHMAGVAARYGESHVSATLLPLSVDGLIVVASVSLVELAGRIRAAEEQRRSVEPARLPGWAAPTPDPTSAPRPVQAVPVTASASVPQIGFDLPRPRPAAVPNRPAVPSRTAASARPDSTGPAPARPGNGGRNPQQQASRQRRPVAETAALASQLEAEYPDLSQAELAERLGISASRLRAIRREVRDLERAA